MHAERPPDWQLPAGVSGGLWDYLHDREVAEGYDAGLTSSLLFRTDLEFAESHCPEPGSLLDLGCGTGRALLHFARNGYSVVGADLSREMLRVASQKAVSSDLPVDLLHLNITDLSSLASEQFDYGLCLFSTLGMVSGAENRRKVCQEVCRALRPGGTFILHVHNRWHNLWSHSGRKWLIGNLWRSLLRREDAGDCLMPSHQGVGAFVLHLFTRREAIALLEESGLEIREIRPVSLRGDGWLRAPWWMSRARAYGYLIAACRPVK